MVTPRVFRLIGYRTGSVFSPEPSGPASEPVYVEDTTAVLGTEAADLPRPPRIPYTRIEIHHEDAQAVAEFYDRASLVARFCIPGFGAGTTLNITGLEGSAIPVLEVT